MAPQWISCLALVLLVASGSSAVQRKHSATRPHCTSPAAHLPAAPTGANRCIVCHRSEVEGYSRSAMAHSLRPAGREPDGVVTTPDARITMHATASGYWQRLESGGETSNYRIDYVIGSGNHASGYLLDIEGRLFESPVAYYRIRHAYGLAPGYQGQANPDFTRPITDGCLFCHSGTALPVPGTANQYRPAVFAADAITCERCHGSASEHLRDPRDGNIINPAKLEPAARNSICEQCHLLGVARVLNPGMKFSDFRPGMRTEDVFATYHDALPAGEDAGKFKVISHVEQLARSTCARMSGGKLWCGTCHDPHDKPLDPVPYYRAKCLSCHTQKFSVASHPGRQSNCIGCHMPRRNAKDGGHTVFTDHRIQRRPQPAADLPADTDIAAWREPAPELQKRDRGIAYINVGMQRHSPLFIARGYRLLTDVQQQFSTDPDIFTAIGNALLLAKKTSESSLAFERALQLEPHSATNETNAAAACLQAGDRAGAVSHLQRAIVIDPFYLPAITPLIQIYQQTGDAARAAGLSARISTALEQQSLRAEAPQAPSSTPQTSAAATYKNIQVLKDISSDQLIPTMRFISSSLGVECSYCHVPEHFEKDDKKPKLIARKMMRMMLAIDKTSFDGSRQITCYSCHRGSLKPQATPAFSNELSPQTVPLAAKLASPQPTTDQIIGDYIRALGGAGAIAHITSLVEKGIATEMGRSGSLEIFIQSPEEETLIRHLSAGKAVMVFNGHRGWTSMPGRASREMHGGELDVARMDADLQFALHLANEFDRLRAEYPEDIGGRPVYVISGMRVGQPPVRFYFDEQSGLLLRLVRYAESPLGRDPVQIDYSDYRRAGGVAIPFRWTIADPERKATIQLQEVRPNVSIDPGRFLQPQSAAPSQSPQ